MKRFLQILLVVVSVAYPFLVYFALPHFSVRFFALLLLLVFGLRWLQGEHQSGWRGPLLVGTGVATLTLVVADPALLKLYPALMSFSFFVLFAWSLKFPPSIVERIARATEPAFPEAHVRYTNRVSKVWCIFFIVNGSLATLTALYGSDALWTLYTGLISYLLMGTLLFTERLFRPFFIRHFA